MSYKKPLAGYLYLDNEDNESVYGTFRYCYVCNRKRLITNSNKFRVSFEDVVNISDKNPDSGLRYFKDNWEINLYICKRCGSTETEARNAYELKTSLEKL